MKIYDLRKRLIELQRTHGNVEIVVWDEWRNKYMPLEEDDVYFLRQGKVAIG